MLQVVYLFVNLIQRLSSSLYVDDLISVLISPNCTIDTMLENEIFVKTFGNNQVLRSQHVESSLNRLRSHACTIRVEYYPVHGRYKRSFDCDDPYRTYQSHLETSFVRNAWGSGGNGTYIIVVDDGISNHYELRVDTRFLVSDDVLGSHGTSVAGITNALSNNMGGCGVAPLSRLVDINLLSNTFLSDIGEAMAFDDIHQDWNAVYGSSWGPTDDGRCEAPGHTLLSVLEKGVTQGRNGRGCIYVFAAGNGGINENMNDDGYANHPFTISVGALNGNDAAYFSEWGAGITVTADGYQILTTSGTSSFIYFYGTSASSPIVVGIISLMLSENDNLGWRDVQEILMFSSIRLAGEGWTTNSNNHLHHYSFGAGKVHAERAVNLAKRWVNLPQQRNETQHVVVDKMLPVLSGISYENSFRVEHVRVCMSITHASMTIGDGSKVGAWIESPYGTRGILSKPTSRVSIIAGCSYHHWCATSLFQWGEDSAGVWTFYAEDVDNTQKLHEINVTLFGASHSDEFVSCE